MWTFYEMQKVLALKSTTSFLILVIFRGEQRKQHYSYKRERTELAQRNSQECRNDDKVGKRLLRRGKTKLNAKCLLNGLFTGHVLQW